MLFLKCAVFLLLGPAVLLVQGQFGSFDYVDEELLTEYRGKFIGDLSTFHHQVSGEVYAVDEHTLLLKDFTYDGNGRDTFFFVGSTNQPNRRGDIVPNEYGRTNVLHRYLNDEFTLTLPFGKRVQDLKWFSIYDLTEIEAYGALYIPDDFEPPKPQILSHLQGFSNNVLAEQVVVLDSKTIKLVEFTYDGAGGDGVHFWVGRGPQPGSKGHIVPDELGYLQALRRYNREDVVLQLPGVVSIADIRWFSIYDKKRRRDFGHVIVPEHINVPPSLSEIIDVDPDLPNCQMLHSNLAVAWSVFAPSITITLTGNIAEDEYMAFGVSKPGDSKMVGSDVAVAYIDGLLGHVDDYNITARSPCTGVLGVNRGVCPDLKAHVGGTSDNQIQTFRRDNGITTLTYRKTLNNANDRGDNEINENGLTSIVWAIGRLAQPGGSKSSKEPSFHHTYPKRHIQLNFGRNGEGNNCVPFVKKASYMMSRKKFQDNNELTFTTKRNKSWGPHRHNDFSLRTFDARLGPPGGAKGYSGITGMPSNGFVWYINGYLASELYMRRGLTYAFRVEGGQDPYSAEFYNPMVITTDPIGGYERMSEGEQKKIRILAGVEFTRRGVARPTASGRLCMWTHPETADRRLDDTFDTFEKFRNSLRLECEEDGGAAILSFTPNITWPDVVYYNSYTHPYMGWRINIVDDFNQRFNFGNTANRSMLPFAWTVYLTTAAILATVFTRL